MYNKTNLIITGATVAMLLLPMKTDAQKLESSLRKNAPESVIQKARKTPPCRSAGAGRQDKGCLSKPLQGQNAEKQ